MSSVLKQARLPDPAPALPASPAVHSRLKRAIDLGLTLPLLLGLAPLFVLVAVIIKLQDGGPVIYRRRVIGLQGEYDAFKFRTMHPDAEEWLSSHPLLKVEFERNFKLQNDPRLTRVGVVLRKFSLDELPQLINVLRGEMSLVGPRMITAAELDKYGSYRDLLLTMKPGLTGYWQVNGRQNVSYDQRARMDVLYIRNWTIGTDLRIILKTPFKIFKREGAY
jgi:lipopolysaccharide/colanic/teichoic acid biosynthesis glycosyltransferase